jgi:hypothetical protein
MPQSSPRWGIEYPNLSSNFLAAPTPTAILDQNTVTLIQKTGQKWPPAPLRQAPLVRLWLWNATPRQYLSLKAWSLGSGTPDPFAFTTPLPYPSSMPQALPLNPLSQHPITTCHSSNHTSQKNSFASSYPLPDWHKKREHWVWSIKALCTRDLSGCRVAQSSETNIMIVISWKKWLFLYLALFAHDFNHHGQG